MEYKIMNPVDLRKMQLIQLDMLLEVDRICKQHQIKYCIIAGTLLGAVRHGGFIPWDDDIDVAMLRHEYEKFSKVWEKELNHNKFFFQTMDNTKNYRWGYGKIRRVGTEFIRKGQEHMKHATGVFIDIFPLDNVPDNFRLRRLHNFICTLIRKLLWSKAGAKSDKSRFMRILYAVIAMTVPKKAIKKMYDLLVRLSNKKETQMVRILTFPTPNNGHYGYYRRWYETLQDILFEGHYFPAAKDYDAYLTFKFGDYHQLPPVEGRQGHSFAKYKLL